MVPADRSTARGDRRPWLIAAVALVGLAQVALAGRTTGALAEYWLAVAMGWACAASLWQFDGDGAATSRWCIAVGTALVAVSVLELVPVEYRTPHRIASLGAGLGLALLAGPGELRRQARGLTMLLCPLLLPAPKPVRELLDLCPLTAAGAAFCLKLAGVPVVRSDVELLLPGSTVLVAEGCSGLSQIFALLFMATFAIFLFPTSRRQRIWLLATAPLVGFACNALRIAALAILADRGERRLFDAWHDGALSPLCTVFAVGLALAIWLPLLRRQPHGPPTDGEPA